MGLWDLLSTQWQAALQEIQPLVEHIDTGLNLLVAEGIELAPSKPDIFAALPISPDLVNVIIVGQDPYPTSGHATGLAFSVPNDTNPLPPTLRNVLRELQADLPASNSTNYDLSPWRDQGVLLLNRVLTTEVGRSLVHLNLGWQEVTLEIVRAVRRVNPSVVGVLWGNQARTLFAEFSAERVVTSVHPSPLSAYRGFFGSKPFSKVNELLAESGQSSINW